MSTKTLLTLEQFEKLQPEEGVRHELDEGELITMTFPRPRHNLVLGNVYAVLRQFVRDHSLGVVFPSDTGYELAAQPATVRGPDVSFVRHPRAARLDLDQSRIPGAPDLAVEVFSESDTHRSMSRKAPQYLQAGAQAVWIFYPDTQEVGVIDVRGERWLGPDETLEAPELLPGFAVPVSSLFA